MFCHSHERIGLKGRFLVFQSSALSASHGFLVLIFHQRYSRCMRHISMDIHGSQHKWLSWCVCVCVCVRGRGRGRECKRAWASEHVSERQDEISKKIYQSFGGVTEYSFKMLQEVSNSLNIMGSINIFSVLFLNLSFYTSCIFPWESRNPLLWKLKCFLIRLTLYIIHADCFIYITNPLTYWSFLVWFKARLLPADTQPPSWQIRFYLASVVYFPTSLKENNMVPSFLFSLSAHFLDPGFN